jgi:hypothetical protein
VPLLLVEFRAEAAQVLRILTAGMGFTGVAFADTLFVVQSGEQRLAIEGKKGAEKPGDWVGETGTEGVAKGGRGRLGGEVAHLLPCCFCQRSMYSF